MVEIIPAILPKSFKDLDEHAQRVEGFVTQVQVDVVDHRFARNKTWPYKDAESFEKIVADEQGLPFWQHLDYEFDLMIEDPHVQAKRYTQAGASRIVVHANAHGAVEGLQMLADLREGDDRAFSVTTGLALECDMQPDVLDAFDALFDFVQVMGIKKIGYQGQTFDAHAVPLIERLRHRYPDLTIQVDGGVRLENCRALAHAGANRLIVGSAIFGADNPQEAYRALYTEANATR